MATAHPDARPIITLTTDFGTRDWFVGVLKGVIASIAPEARVIDISHEVPAFDIRAGAYVLNAAFAYFPQGSIHVAVIDPTVGTDRRPVLASAGGHWFIGPDNGLLWLALETAAKNKALKTWILNRPSSPVSQTGDSHPEYGKTFDGRDVFSACAARLASGLAPEELGARVDPGTLVRLGGLRPEKTATGIAGEAIYRDRFGNLITNITMNDIAALLPEGAGPDRAAVKAGGLSGLRIVTAYADMAQGETAAVINSSGFLELCAFQAAAPIPDTARVFVSVAR